MGDQSECVEIAPLEIHLESIIIRHYDFPNQFHDGANYFGSDEHSSHLFVNKKVEKNEKSASGKKTNKQQRRGHSQVEPDRGSNSRPSSEDYETETETEIEIEIEIEAEIDLRRRNLLCRVKRLQRNQPKPAPSTHMLIKSRLRL